MKNFIAIVVSLSLLVAAHAGDGSELRSFKNENVGKVTLVAPGDWKPIERHHINFGTTFYRLLPPSKGQFDFEILVNDLAHMRMEALRPAQKAAQAGDFGRYAEFWFY